jgi:hypothetical protein
MANVTPGIQFISGETVTPAKLNAAASPTVAVANNEITTATILDGAVTAPKLATGAVTGAAGGGKLAASAISGQTAITTLADDDAFIVHDDNDATLKKITKASLSSELVGDGSITAAKINGVAKDGAGADLAVGTPPVFGCRAWVNFDGTKDTTGANSTANTNRLIRASGNVSSVLRTGLGQYTVTFATAMPDANYCVFGSAEAVTVNRNNVSNGAASGFLSASVGIIVSNTSQAGDNTHVTVAVVR